MVGAIVLAIVAGLLAFGSPPVAVCIVEAVVLLAFAVLTAVSVVRNARQQDQHEGKPAKLSGFRTVVMLAWVATVLAVLLALASGYFLLVSAHLFSLVGLLVGLALLAASIFTIRTALSEVRARQ